MNEPSETRSCYAISAQLMLLGVAWGAVGALGYLLSWRVSWLLWLASSLFLSGLCTLTLVIVAKIVALFAPQHEENQPPEDTKYA